MISAELPGLALTGLANDAGPRLEPVAYALNRPTRTQDAVITMAGHSCGPKTKEGRQRVSKAHLKHGHFTKDKKLARAEGAAIERKLRARRKLIENELRSAGVI